MEKMLPEFDGKVVVTIKVEEQVTWIEEAKTKLW